MFIGREQELRFFEDKYSSADGQLIVLYGRRRIGKTETLHRFCDGKPHIFYSCREISDSMQLAAFSERILHAGSPAAKYVDTFRDWETAFRSILEIPASGEKKLLVIDEFPYMCKGNASIPSILQILWDESLRHQNVMIILCGSAMSFIEKKLLSKKNPLYGRTTGIYKMNELPYDDAVKFFPVYTAEHKMLAYSILGGIPHYLKQFNPNHSLRENIINNILTKGCVLYSEVEFLIRQELREPALYNTIVDAIALGSTKLNDIFTKTQIDRPKISVYLKNLIELKIIEREFSVLSSGKEKATSTRGLYKITDNFFRFWYSFVFANLSDLEAGDAAGVFDNAVQPQFNDFASMAFESVCCEFIRNMNQRNKLEFRITNLGRWWGKVNQTVIEDNGKCRIASVESEIDIVALDANYRNYILCECKFSNSKMDISDLRSLMEKASFIREGAMVQYMLFSKSGFTNALISLADENKNVQLFSLTDVLPD